MFPWPGCLWAKGTQSGQSWPCGSLSCMNIFVFPPHRLHSYPDSYFTTSLLALPERPLLGLAARHSASLGAASGACTRAKSIMSVASALDNICLSLVQGVHTIFAIACSRWQNNVFGFHESLQGGLAERLVPRSSLSNRRERFQLDVPC